jgi:hypothetical protein
MAMDLRYAVFTRIARGRTCSKRLLVNYAGPPRRFRGRERYRERSLLSDLEWTADDRTNTPSEAESVTFRAHVPRHRREDYSCLDVVMYRLEAALARTGTDSSIAILRRRSREAVECGADTVSDQDLRRLSGTAPGRGSLTGRSRSDRFRDQQLPAG